MELSEILPVLIPLIILQVALAVYALYDLYRRGGTRPPLPTWVWVALILLGQFWGPLLYFFLGRREDV
ncbi:MAG: PLD nuclease N-terminal domain-containing protein [Chloroflexota bacterium]|nr:PLD nuclease N-terminal domain-containing protein [Anaerolineae bacterium]HMM29586.1 PLD nuclease N-terminal domain-containing protein [Aggregatilineaceae bacterium]